MATIRISTQILDGNLGDGWRDNYEAAQALAEFTRRTWETDTEEFQAAGHIVEISVDVQRNSSGHSRDLDVDCGVEEWALRRAVEARVTNESVIWDRFCESDAARRA